MTAPWTSETLRIYILEALRLIPPAAPYLRTLNTYSGIIDWRYAQAIKKGDMLLLAGRIVEKFLYSNVMRLDRILTVYNYVDTSN